MRRRLSIRKSRALRSSKNRSRPIAPPRVTQFRADQMHQLPTAKLRLTPTLSPHQVQHPLLIDLLTLTRASLPVVVLSAYPRRVAELTYAPVRSFGRGVDRLPSHFSSSSKVSTSSPNRSHANYRYCSLSTFRV